VVGRHDGIESFTIGQRKGLGVALGEPQFVVRIEPDSLRVVIGRREELARRELVARRVNWLCTPPAGHFRCWAQIRYNSPPAAATAECRTDGELNIEFDEPRYGVAPGQALVCYAREAGSVPARAPAPVERKEPSHVPPAAG
jgi:tRNA-specific 2-thiouridylase